MSEHVSPTPWQEARAADANTNIADADGRLVAWFYHEHDRAMALRAVNHLEARILAACELYGALAQLIEVSAGCGPTACFSPDPELMQAAIKRGKAAMAQAEQVGR